VVETPKTVGDVGFFLETTSWRRIQQYQHHTKAISVRIVDQPQAMFIAWA